MEPKPLLKLHEQICRSENLESDVDKYVASLYIKIRFFNRIKTINETTKAAENKEKFRRMKQTAQFMFWFYDLFLQNTNLFCLLCLFKNKFKNTWISTDYIQVSFIYIYFYINIFHFDVNYFKSANILQPKKIFVHRKIESKNICRNWPLPRPQLALTLGVLTILYIFKEITIC